MALEHSPVDLLRRAQGGDTEAFAALVEAYRPRLERQIEARMGAAVRSRLEPADVLQETIARALSSIGHLDPQGEDSIYRWLGSIAEHLIRNAQKKKSPELLRVEPLDRESASGGRRLRRQERFERLEGSLRGLPPDQRQALLLTRVDGLSLKDVAARMGRTPGAVQKLVARALLSLRQSFGDTESLHLPDRRLEGEEPPR
jgi:RNA polymerase sigma-70 factor (ECF subfamily)